LLVALSQAGIRVVVVTGDNQATAEAVCRSIGALGVDSGLDEQQLSSLTGVWGCHECVLMLSAQGQGCTASRSIGARGVDSGLDEQQLSSLTGMQGGMPGFTRN
jgi:magnesium-transporting ATPase (P-type)